MHRNKSILSGVCAVLWCACFIYIVLDPPPLSSHQPNPIRCILAGWVVRVLFSFHLMYVYYTKCIHCLRLMISARLIAVYFISFILIILIRVCMSCTLIYFHTRKARKAANPTVSSLLFVALSGKQKSQHYQINQRTTVLVSQMNQMLAIVFISLRCVRKRFSTLFSFNPFVCNQKSLSGNCLPWSQVVEVYKPTEILPLIRFKWCSDSTEAFAYKRPYNRCLKCFFLNVGKQKENAGRKSMDVSKVSKCANHTMIALANEQIEKKKFEDEK